MSLSKDYISWRWFLHWENYASLNWNVFRKLLCECFLTRNAEGDLFASLIEQHLLRLEEKPFHVFSLSYPAFLWSPLLLPLPIACITGAGFCLGRSARHSCGMFWALQCCWCIFAVGFSFSCWISQNHTVSEAGKNLWDPWVQPVITLLSTDTWELSKKSLPLLPLKSWNTSVIVILLLLVFFGHLVRKFPLPLSKIKVCVPGEETTAVKSF